MKLLLLFFTFSFSTLLIEGQAAEMKDSKYESEIVVGQAECLQPMSQNRGFGSSYQLKFYNACPERIWASVCVEERPGKFKLHESASKIPEYGYFTIYTHEGSPPVSVTYKSSKGKPGAIGQCAVPENKK